MKFDTLIIEPITTMTMGVISFLPTLFLALGILIIGWAMAKMVTKVIVTFLRAISFDKHADKLGLSKLLKTGDVKHKPSSLIGCITYWVLMVMVLITTVKAVGLPLASDYFDKLFAYIPHVVIGALTLIIGMLLARVVSALIYVTAKHTDMPIPDALRDLSKFAIVIYVAIIYLKEVGFVSLFTGPHYTIFITGIVFSIALAFGLAGKDVAHKYLDVFKK